MSGLDDVGRLWVGDSTTERDAVLTLLVGLAILVGLVGIVIPVLPGSILIGLAVLVWAVMTGTVLSWWVFAAVALLLVYVLFVERGFRIAVLARDSFSKLLATGLTTVVALQVFVIVGGVTKVIPLTGVTLPFVSYGGSSIVANFVIVALLLLVSDRARREARSS